MKLLIFLIASVVALSDSPAKLTQDQIHSLEQSNLQVQLLDVQKQLVEAQKQLMLVQACNKAQIFFDDCVIKPDYTLAKRVTTEAVPSTK